MRKFVTTAILLLLMASSAKAGDMITVQSWQFNTPGDTENWIARSTWVMPSGVEVTTDVDGVESVLTAPEIAGNGDMGVIIDPAVMPIALPIECSEWHSITIRVRQLDADPPDGRSIPWQGGAQFWISSLGIVDTLPATSNANWTVVSQPDNWMLYTRTLQGRTADLDYIRFDPYNNIDGNFEIDYIELNGVPSPYPPTADAGPDQTLTDSDDDGTEVVTLDGSASFDSNGTVVSYQWKIGDAQIATGVNPTVSLTTGYHKIDLIVTDNDGHTDTDSVVVVVNVYTTDPTADAGPNQFVSDDDGNGYEQVTFDGSNSTAIIGATITSYVWKEAGSVIATGTTPDVTLATGTHLIILEVTDDAGRTDADTVQIRVAAPTTADWYVDAINGDDDTGDGSSANPFKTIAAVWPQLGDGDVVALRDGVYDPIEIYSTTYVGSPGSVFSDWVTFRPDTGAFPQIDHIWIGLSTPASTDYSDGLGGTFDTYLRFEGIHVTDGVQLGGARYVEFDGCRMTKVGPYVGSEEDIAKTAVHLGGVSYITVKDCEITDTGIGIFCQGRYVNLLKNHIHNGSHDGIRPWGMWHSLIEGNVIHDFDDGVSDDEQPWSKHCDLVHFSIRGPGLEGWGNHDVIFRGNTLYHCESQALIINGYIANDTSHSDIVIENNVFAPSYANMVNIVEKTNGLIFRNNTVCNIGDSHRFGRWTQDNYTIRIGGITGVQIYNNIVKSFGISSSAEIDFFDFNIVEAPYTAVPPVGVDQSRSYGRFTMLDVDPQLVDPQAMDGELAATSPAINAGTSRFAPTAVFDYDIIGTLRDIRPDIGAWELAGQSPAAETEAPVHNDIKTIFVDDFEDGHYKDVDPWLNAPATQGMSWYRPDGFDEYKYNVRCEGLNRNTLFMPLGTTDGRAAWLVSEQGSDWTEYTFEFQGANAYVSLGAGVVVLVKDIDNCYYLDLSSQNGRLIRILDGVETVLMTSSAIQMPATGLRDYKIGVKVEPTGTTITVDTNRDGSIDMTYTDTDPAAMAVLNSGGVGFHCDNSDKWHYMRFDDIRIELTGVSQSRPVGRYVFYNESSFDGNDPAGNDADDAAIASDKFALLPGQTASYSNYTSYVKGINGIMVDLPDLSGSAAVSDFEFKVGNDTNPAGWAAAPAAVSITTRNDDGITGSDRVTIIWANGAIKGKWLQVTVKANAVTNLDQDDVFYFGNAVGETGISVNDTIVDATDEVETRNHPRNFMRPAPVDYAYDHNRDGKVDATDEIICRNNITDFSNRLILFTAP